MLEIAKQYYQFWNQVLPAYVEGEVSEDAALPYLTYTLQRSGFGEEGMQQVRIWTHSRSFAPLWEYTEKVEKMIPESGHLLQLPDEAGGIYIYRGRPFIQYLTMPDQELDYLKTAYINLVIRTYVL